MGWVIHVSGGCYHAARQLGTTAETSHKQTHTCVRFAASNLEKFSSAASQQAIYRKYSQ